MPNYFPLLAGKFKGLVKLWLHQSKTEEVIEFTRSGTLASSAALAGISLLGDAEIPSGFTAYVRDWMVDVGGATAWTDSTATKVGLYDTNGSPVTFFEVAKAGLTANTTVVPGMSNVTNGAGYRANTGATAGKGLVFKGDASFAAGSTITVVIDGFLRKS